MAPWFAVFGAVLLLAALVKLSMWWRDRKTGALVSVDLRGRASQSWRAPEFALVGRPDAVRQIRDGRRVPVEIKSRDAPPGGPAFSHQVQVWAYCLIVESTTGRATPFGVLQYNDVEYRIPWTAESRAQLLALRAQALRPYDGRATPSPGRCRRCSWRESCDARAI